MSKIFATIQCTVTSTRSFSKISFLATVLLFLSSLVASAQTQIDLSKIREAYIKAAFPFGVGSLKKFEDPSHITYSLNCNADNKQKCTKAVEYFRAAIFENSNMQLEQKEVGRLIIDFSSYQTLSEKKVKLSQAFPSGVVDAEDIECQLYVGLMGDFITNAALIVSVDAPPQKIVSCLLVGFYRALGLSQEGNRTFAESWAEIPDKKNDIPLEELKKLAWFQDLKKAAVILQYIHSCPKLLAGMTKNAAMTRLEGNSFCFRDLLGDNQ